LCYLLVVLDINFMRNITIKALNLLNNMTINNIHLQKVLSERITTFLNN